MVESLEATVAWGFAPWRIPCYAWNVKQYTLLFVAIKGPTVWHDAWHICTGTTQCIGTKFLIEKLAMIVARWRSSIRTLEV